MNMGIDACRLGVPPQKVEGERPAKLESEVEMQNVIVTKSEHKNRTYAKADMTLISISRIWDSE